LIRPGRIDVRIHFGNATKHQAEELFTKFYPHLESNHISRLASQFAAKIPDNQFSMAHLQGFLMVHKKHPDQALDLIDDWIRQQSDQNGATATTTATTTSSPAIEASEEMHHTNATENTDPLKPSPPKTQP
jgi:chaperone BCS1